MALLNFVVLVTMKNKDILFYSMFKLSSTLVGQCIQKTVGLTESLVVQNMMSFSWADMVVKGKVIIILLKQVECNNSGNNNNNKPGHFSLQVCRKGIFKSTNTGVFCKHPEYILITERFHMPGKDRGSCALNKKYCAARKQEQRRRRERERASGMMRI